MPLSILGVFKAANWLLVIEPGDKAKDAGFKEGREHEFRFEEYYTDMFYRMLRMYTLEAILQIKPKMQGSRRAGSMSSGSRSTTQTCSTGCFVCIHWRTN